MRKVVSFYKSIKKTRKTISNPINFQNKISLIKFSQKKYEYQLKIKKEFLNTYINPLLNLLENDLNYKEVSETTLNHINNVFSKNMPFQFNNVLGCCRYFSNTLTRLMKNIDQNYKLIIDCSFFDFYKKENSNFQIGFQAFILFHQNLENIFLKINKDSYQEIYSLLKN